MRETYRTDDAIYNIVEDIALGKCKSKTFYINDEHGFLVKIRVEDVPAKIKRDNRIY